MLESPQNQSTSSQRDKSAIITKFGHLKAEFKQGNNEELTEMEEELGFVY